jgi:HD-GYP domain
MLNFLLYDKRESFAGFGMKTEIKKHSALVRSDKVAVGSVFEWEQVNCQYFHLFKDNSLHMDKEESDIIDHTKLCYMVLHGCVEFCLPGNRFELHEFESVEIEYGVDAVSFDVFAKSETHILYFVSAAALDTNTEMNALMQQIDEQERRDVYTKRHNFRTSKYADMMMQIVDPHYNGKELSFAGSFHDIGKLHIPEGILNKPAKLTKEEFDIVKRHPVHSYEMLLPTAGERVARIARQHHEKLDGSGYPDGLTEKEILPEAKVLAVADIFDALTSARSYRQRAFTFAEALEIIRVDVENHKLDRDAYLALKKLVEEGMLKEGEDNL